MISIDEALRRMGAAVDPLPVDAVGLDAALHRVLAEPVASKVPLPPFRQSSMDGFALRSHDTVSASRNRPAELKVVGEIPAGEGVWKRELQPGEAVAIYTGGLVPLSADAVVPVEEASFADEKLRIRTPVPSGDYIRERGEELQAGTQLAPPGVRLTAGLIGALAVAGRDRLTVRQRPRVAVLTTGDEVVPPGDPLAPGQVFDGNAALITSWLQERGYRADELTHVADDLHATETALCRALGSSDLVLVAGGVSVGDRDYVRPAARNVRVNEVFWRVKQKPGKPLLLGMSGRVPILGLPGNPGAVFVCLNVFARRLLDLLEGASAPGPRFQAGRLGFSVRAPADRDAWVRCRIEIDQEGAVRLVELSHQASHMISNLALCNALVRVPAGSKDLTEGDLVDWMSCRVDVAADPIAPGW